MDLCAVEDIMLRPGVPTLVKTGLSIELPPYYEAQVRPRGGLALKYGLQVVNSPGTVDPAYRGDIGVILLWSGFNSNMVDYYVERPDIAKGTDKFKIKKGDRIAQLVVARYEPVEWSEVEDLSTTVRGAGAYGSTGINLS